MAGRNKDARHSCRTRATGGTGSSGVCVDSGAVLHFYCNVTYLFDVAVLFVLLEKNDLLWLDVAIAALLFFLQKPQKEDPKTREEIKCK